MPLALLHLLSAHGGIGRAVAVPHTPAEEHTKITEQMVGLCRIARHGIAGAGRTRPGEDDRIGTFPNGAALLRYDPASPWHGMDGDWEAMAHYAGTSALMVRDIQPVKKIIQEMSSVAEATLLRAVEQVDRTVSLSSPRPTSSLQNRLDGVTAKVINRLGDDHAATLFGGQIAPATAALSGRPLLRAGDLAPDFELADVFGRNWKLSETSAATPRFSDSRVLSRYLVSLLQHLFSQPRRGLAENCGGRRHARDHLPRMP